MWWLAACAEPPPPAPAPAPLPPLVIAACDPVPDDVASAVLPDVAVDPRAIADRVARGGSRCPWSEGPEGRGAVVLDGRLAIVRRWPEAPAEVLLIRPIPRDGEGRLAASVAWPDGGVAITWWDEIAHPCTEEVVLSSPPRHTWTCPDRPAPAVETGVPWPDPNER
jgi:hypothetical protein